MGLAFLLACQMGTSTWQVVAWVGMIVDYSLEEASLSEGLKQTFSGEKPCNLCEAIDESQKGEPDQKKSNSPTTKVSVELTKAEPKEPCVYHFMSLDEAENLLSPKVKLFQNQFKSKVLPPIPIFTV